MSPSEFRKHYNSNPKGAMTWLRYNKSIISDIRKKIKTEFNLTDNEIIYLYLNEEIDYICPICKNRPKKFKKISKGYQSTCSDYECRRKYRSQINKESSKKIDWKSSVIKAQKTQLSRTGFKSNLSKNSPGRKKAEKAMISKYGVKSPLMDEGILEKRNKTCLERHNTLNFIQLHKSKETLFNNYGVSNPMHSDKIKLKNARIQSENKWKDLYQRGLAQNVILKYKESTFDKRLTVECNTCNNIDTDVHRQKINMLLTRNESPCSKCNPIFTSRSIIENNVADFIQKHCNDIQLNQMYDDRKYELDIYIPSLNLGIEVNGVYWHSELYKDKNYHQEKVLRFKELGIDVFNIWEDDWLYKQDIIKSMIRSKLGLCERIYARKCQIKEVDFPTTKAFLNENHLQGSINSGIRYGLYYNNKLVSVMTFGKLRRALGTRSIDNHFELHRFCNKRNITIIGGFSKLLKHFIKLHNPNELYSYANLDHSNGNVYEKSGFKLDSITTPGYWWIIDGIKHHRYKYRKSELVKEGHDPNLTEFEIMTQQGYYRLWDSGNLKYQYNINKN